MSEPMQSYDVVICGAGPVGLIIAYYLSRAGLSAFLAEKLERDEQSSYGRACTLHQRTLEMLDQVDLYDDMSQVGVIARSANNWDKNGERAPARGWQSLMSKSEPTYFDFALNIRQKFSEEVFRKRLALHGGKVDTLWTVEAFTVNKTGSYPVEATLQHTQSRETKRVVCKYIAGSDGAHSTIRQLAGIPFEGDVTARKWVRIDGVVKTNIPQNRTTMAAIESPTHGNVLYVNLDHGATRIGYVLSDKLAAKYGEKLTEEEAVYEAKQAVAPFEIEFLKVDWFTTYGIGQRVAATYIKDERIILAGDAAHTHSSGLAQGMNTGVHDAINLSWKLAGTIKGLYDPSILLTYEQERRPAAQKLIEIDKRVTRLISADLPADIAAGRDMNELMSELINTTRSFNTGLGIGYCPNLINSSIVNAGTISTGERGPDALLRKPGLRISHRLHEILKNNVKLHILVFTGACHKTMPQLKDISNLMKTSSLASGLQPAFDFLTIIPGQGTSVYETLGGLDAFGRVWWDPDEHVYSTYGIMDEGGILAIRPDGYIGAAEGLTKKGMTNIEKYLEAFVLKASE